MVDAILDMGTSHSALISKFNIRKSGVEEYHVRVEKG